MSNWFGKQNYNYASQIIEMRKLYQHFDYKINTDVKGYITFTGTLQPHPYFPEYTVKITYRDWKNPRAQILSPRLVEGTPHYYSKTRTVCLYHPDNFQWKKDISIATTIVPWVSSWIFFYEVWKQTGTWFGEEADHTNDKKEEN